MASLSRGIRQLNLRNNFPQERYPGTYPVRATRCRLRNPHELNLEHSAHGVRQPDSISPTQVV